MNKFFQRLSIQDRVMFAKRLSILVKAGVPLLEGIRMLKNSAGSRSAFLIYSQIVLDVEKGKFLATSLESFKHVFGDFAVNVVRVGEMSGNLEGNLSYLAEELKKKQELKRKVVGALVYPAIVVTATIALSIMLTAFIFPKIMPIFESFKFELPFTTRALIFVSGIFLNYGVFIFFGFIGLVILFIFLYRMPGFKIVIDRIILKIPIFGKLAQSYQMANFSRTLALLIKSQIMLVDAARITGDTLNNLVYRKEIHKMSKNLLKGEKISTHLDRKKKLFPPMMTQMVAVGEKTGNLSDTLLYISEIYENEVDSLTKNLSTSLEPILMIIMGAVVGFIAVSIITPIYEVTQHINP